MIVSYPWNIGWNLWQVTAAPPTSQPRMALLTELIYDLLILMVIVAFGGMAIIIASRRFRDSLSRKPPRPTSAEDVWALHVPPNVELEEPESKAGGDDDDSSENPDSIGDHS